MANKVTQTGVILEHLYNHGSITSYEAFQLYGITRLAAVIYEVKKALAPVGKTVKSEPLSSVNRYGKTVYFSSYSIAEKEHK